MSHFTVAVFHRPDQDVETLLAPYDENIQVEPYVQFTRQQAIDYARQHYKSMADASDEACYAYIAEDYKTDVEGNLLSTYNPRSKWDWWSEGGRWDGMLRTATGELNSARIADIDFTPDAQKYKAALRYWDVIVEHQPKLPGEDFFSLYNEQYYRDYYGDRETYARYMTQFSTYAVVTPDGEWHEKGSMGWWGCSSETADEAKDWEERYRERFLDSADPDWILTIVDCHI